jgi:hypothetical protein
VCIDALPYWIYLYLQEIHIALYFILLHLFTSSKCSHPTVHKKVYIVILRYKLHTSYHGGSLMAVFMLMQLLTAHCLLSSQATAWTKFCSCRVKLFVHNRRVRSNRRNVMLIMKRSCAGVLYRNDSHVKGTMVLRQSGASREIKNYNIIMEHWVSWDSAYLLWAKLKDAQHVDPNMIQMKCHNKNFWLDIYF